MAYKNRFVCFTDVFDMLRRKITFAAYFFVGVAFTKSEQKYAPVFRIMNVFVNDVRHLTVAVYWHNKTPRKQKNAATLPD